MNQPNQDPLDEILESVYNEAYKCGVGAKHPYRYRTIEAVTSEAKQALLKWRSDYVMGLLDELHRTNGQGLPKRDYDNITDEVIDEITDDIRAKNERGR